MFTWRTGENYTRTNSKHTLTSLPVLETFAGVVRFEPYLSHTSDLTTGTDSHY